MDTQEILKHYISHDLLNDRQWVEAEDDLLGEGIIDSMGVMRLVAFLEEKFDCRIPQEDIIISHFRTIELIDAYLAHRSSLAE